MSLAVECHNKHKAIQQRIAEAAKAHEASKRTALVAELKECCTTKPKPEPEPEPVEDGWVNRQISGERKELWFTVVRSIKLNRLGGPPIKEIQRATCETYSIKLNDLLSARRTANVVIPRHVSMYLAKELTTLSWPRIARATGDRDHTVAIYAYNKIKSLIDRDPKLAANVSYLISMFKGVSQ
jgi:hypothetical protein